MAVDSESATNVEERTTAPQSPYSMRQVAVGLIILLLGIVIVFLIPGMIAYL